MNTATILELAADRLEHRVKWTQCPGPELMGECAAIAVAKAAQTIGFGFNSDEAMSALAIAVGGCRNDPNSIFDWNDAPGRTKEEVIAMLRAVAASERARAALPMPAEREVSHA